MSSVSLEEMNNNSERNNSKHSQSEAFMFYLASLTSAAHTLRVLNLSPMSCERVVLCLVEEGGYILTVCDKQL